MAKKSNVVDLEQDFTEIQEEAVMVADAEIELQVVPDTPACPPKSSLERTKFILGFLDPSESYSGNPKVAGLQRLVEMFVGEIIEEIPTLVSVDLEHNAAAAIHSIKVKKFNGEVVGPFAGCADHTRYNNDNAKFVIFPTTCAQTKARGRAYVLALGIAATSSEEMMYNAPLVEVSGEFTEKEITDAQLNAIDNICKEADINAIKMLGEKVKALGLDKVRDLRKSDGVDVLRAIQVFRQGTPVPTNLMGYKSGWRN